MSDLEEKDDQQGMQENTEESSYQALPLRGMYENWFLDYASYVILERAVPEITTD